MRAERERAAETRRRARPDAARCVGCSAGASPVGVTIAWRYERDVAALTAADQNLTEHQIAVAFRRTAFGIARECVRREREGDNTAVVVTVVDVGTDDGASEHRIFRPHRNRTAHVRKLPKWTGRDQARSGRS